MSIRDNNMAYKLTLRIPFETERQAEIACNTLSPDPILKENELSVNYEFESRDLVCKFSAISDRVIRVAVSNVIDNLKTTIECIDEFDGNHDTLFT